jgi:hypothetical protein
VKIGHSGLANWMIRFFYRTPISILLIQSCSYILLILFRQSPEALFHLYLIRSTMSDHEEERGGGSRQGTMSLNIIKEEGSREL